MVRTHIVDREWIVTNGLGSYASLTTSNCNTRKFHGLLVASLDPPTKRWMFVSNVYDKIIVEERIYDLRDCNGRFVFDIFPSFHYDLEGVKIEKTIFMEYQKILQLLNMKLKQIGHYPQFIFLL